MTGIIDVGGGTRGIFGAGVFDYCMDHEIWFDLVIGISAGSANGSSYLARQRGRNYRFYQEYAFRREYMSAHNFLHSGSYIDLDYIYSELSNHDGEYPLDYQAMMDNPAQFVVVATDAETGNPVYFDKSVMEKDEYFPMKASSCVPLVNRPYEHEGHSYFDGGLSDPVPYEKAFAMGCDKLVVVLTRPKEVPRLPGKDRKAARVLRHEFPNIARDLSLRSVVYNYSVRQVLQMEKDHPEKVLVIAPDDISGLKTLTKDHGQLEMMYQKGYFEAEKIAAFLER